MRPRVEETLPFERAGSFASMDSPGPFETKATEAYYYVTPVEANWTEKEKDDWLSAFNYYTGDVVSIHEVYPGHYVQFLCMNASPATRLDKILGSYAFIEGWAHYSEQMLIDEGYGAAARPRGNDPLEIKTAKYRLAQLDESLLRLCRLCVAIKMHCQGMSVEQADEIFPGELLLRRKAGPRRSHARNVRSRLRELHAGEADDSEITQGLSGRRKEPIIRWRNSTMNFCATACPRCPCCEKSCSKTSAPGATRCSSVIAGA